MDVDERSILLREENYDQDLTISRIEDAADEDGAGPIEAMEVADQQDVSDPVAEANVAVSPPSERILNEESIQIDDVSSQSENSITTDEDINDDFIILQKTKYNSLKFMLTNARSLSPKILSFIDHVEQLGVDISVVTKSWLASSSKLDYDLNELEFGTDLKVVYKNRPIRQNSRRRTAGGVVAIIYNKTRCRLKERKIKKNKFELVCATGKVTGMDRELVVIGVYVPPKTNVADFQALVGAVSDLVLEEKVKHKDPMILVAGDFNKRDMEPAFADYVDMVMLQHGPTRGREKLDLIFTNFQPELADTKVLAPLETEGGVMSDHGCVVSQLGFEAQKRFKWKKIKVRKKSEEGNKKFQELYKEMDWDSFYQGLNDPSDLVMKLQTQMESWMNQCFPYRTIRRREDEDPWITNKIRRLIRIRLQIFLLSLIHI